MEGALVSAAAGALKPVVEKLGALLGDKYKRFMGVRTEIKSLTHELTAMEAFLKKMSEVEYPDLQDKIWMNKVRELSYDMEDSLNEFMLRVNHKSTKADSLLEKIKCSLGKMKTRSNIAKEIENLMKQVTLLGERNARYRTGEAISKTSNASVDPRALAIFKHTSKLVGIGEPKDELLKLLAEEDRFASTQQEVKVVSIVGCGGMGKTSLANRVYQELEGQYEHKAFISVSRNPDMMNILRTILSDIAKKVYASTEARDGQHLIAEIYNFLANKRYFIVVDDIWTVKAWDVIQYAFPMKSRGSRIITTTRINDVAKSCCSSSNSHIYNIRPLSMVHSRELFHMRLFNPEEGCPSHLEDVSSQILKKCDGSPLAIIALSGLLADKERTEDKWNQVKDSIGRALERNSSVEDMVQILSLSYFDLPHHLKACLLYLSIFPEDYTIVKEKLIKMWIAEGFIPVENGYTAQESGERCFNELVNRSLIQPVWTGDIFNEVRSCRVHDIILDFIVCKAVEENFVTIVGVPDHTPPPQTTVRRLSLQGGNHGNTMLPTDLESSHVRSLHVFGNSTEIPSLKKFRHLRVVNFDNCHQLENNHLANIGRLFQLRYLDIGRGVTVLPEQIGDLQYLEMLDTEWTRVCELPAAIVRLGKLVHLRTNGFAKLPDGIAKMQALETLDCVCSNLQSCKFLQELGELKNLRKLMLIVSGDFVGGDATGVNRERDKAIASSLSKLGTQSLRSLYCSRNSWSINEPYISILQEPWCPPPLGLREFIVRDSGTVQRVPNWMGSLVNLQLLELIVEEVRQEDLCLLGGLPALLSLHFHINEKAAYLNKLIVNGEDGFPCLRQFTFYGFEELVFGAGCMPKLDKLYISFNGPKTESLTIDAFDFGIEHLSSLCTFGYLEYHGTPRGVIEAGMERASSKHPNHPRFEIRH